MTRADPGQTDPKQTDPEQTDPGQTDPTQTPDDPDQQLSYEQAREELIRVVQQLESGGTPLAESLALWERGERLAARCQEFLDGAQAKIDAARPTGSGQAAEPN